ncbi:MAG: phosphoribosylanthranilate isomerase [Candidatus Binatia bacterium]|nr:phosphoribosylanthranilate isomerase [Candidatus Binatia bacterium]
MVVVKICGVTRPEDAMAAAEAGADWIGLNFYPRSPRFVTKDRACEILAAVPSHVQVVGVFVGATRDEVEETAASLELDLLQFHGDEPPDYCTGWRWPVIKAIRLRTREDWERARSYPVDFLLIDAHVPGQFGGTGETADWMEIARLPVEQPLILAGGLRAENVAQAVRVVRPFAVDVASGVESSPGVKDADALRRFVQNAKSA